jgi:hypothetical protein
MPETDGQHKNGCPMGAGQHDDGPPSRRLLCILFCDREEDTGLADPRHAGWIAAFVLGWYPQARRRRKGKKGNWFSVAQILAGTGLSVNQWRDAKPWLVGAVHVEHGGHAGKRALFMRPTAQLQRFVAGDYPDKKAAKRALEALREAPGSAQEVHPGATQVVLTGDTAGQNQGQQGGPNLILSSLSPLSPTSTYKQVSGLTPATQDSVSKKGKEKTGKIGPSAKGLKIEPEGKYTPPAPPAGGTIDLDALVELIYAAKVAALDEVCGPAPQPPTEEDILFDQKYKKHMLKRLKQDLVLFPEVPIPKGCTTVVHPMAKDPVRWEGLSKKAKTDLYHNKFLNYLENWKNGKAGKHAASAYGIHPKHFPVPKDMYDDDPEMAALDADLAKTMASWDDLDEAA